MFEVIASIVALVAAAAAVMLIMAARKTDTFRVQRTARIQAPPEKIFPLINDFGNWSAWSPYERKNPAMRRARSGAASGPGAVYAWEGDKNVGKGRMEITEARPPSRITLKLDFERPFKANNMVDFTLEPRGQSTDVTWALYGPLPYMAKVMHTIFNMDRMVGSDFEAGLASLKAIAER